MKYLIVLSLLASIPASSQTIEQEITEGKIQAAEIDFLKAKAEEERQQLSRRVDLQMQTALNLIAKVAEVANDRTLRIGNGDERREEAEYAHAGYIAIIQGIREDREALAKKFIEPDTKALQNYSKRLDIVIADAQEFLK